MNRLAEAAMLILQGKLMNYSELVAGDAMNRGYSV